MKNQILKLSLITFLSLSSLKPLLAQETVTKESKEAVTKEANNSKNSGEELLKNLQNEQMNLEDLYKNVKFPVSDYIFEGGFREPDEEGTIKAFADMGEEKENVEDPKEPISTNKAPKIENNATKAKEIQEKLDKLKKETPQPSEKVVVYDPQAHTKKLIRDSILASRNSQIKDFSSSDRFGADGFSNQKSIDIATNEHKLFRMIRAGKLIPATLTSAISSDLNGIVTAQVEQDIYAAMGRAVLIPRGSKVIGFYQNDNKIGQNRLEIKWREIITPQGINILLTDAIVADNMGMSGAIGTVNNKYFERYGIAFGLSTVSNALLLSIASKVDKGGNQYAEDLYSQGKSDIGTIVDDIIQQQSQIKPTIEIKAGSRIYIVPTNHIWFSKPKNGEVMMKYFIENPR